MPGLVKQGGLDPESQKRLDYLTNCFNKGIEPVSPDSYDYIASRPSGWTFADELLELLPTMLLYFTLSALLNSLKSDDKERF